MVGSGGLECAAKYFVKEKELDLLAVAMARQQTQCSVDMQGVGGRREQRRDARRRSGSARRAGRGRSGQDSVSYYNRPRQKRQKETK